MIDLKTLSEETRAVLAQWELSQKASLDERKDPNWFSEHPVSLENLTNREWWVNAREKVVGLDPKDNGLTFCQDWARGMFEALTQNPEMTAEGMAVDVNLMYSDTDDHWWLELVPADKQNTGLFDGTAGGKLKNNANAAAYTDGYYGSKNALLEYLPPNVGDIYRHGDIKQSVSVNIS